MEQQIRIEAETHPVLSQSLFTFVYCIAHLTTHKLQSICSVGSETTVANSEEL